MVSSSPGDLDGDGCEDIAVGSPYEDGGLGAVRIYFGKPSLEAIQVLLFGRFFVWHFRIGLTTHFGR